MHHVDDFGLYPPDRGPWSLCCDGALGTAKTYRLTFVPAEAYLHSASGFRELESGQLCVSALAQRNRRREIGRIERCIARTWICNGEDGLAGSGSAGDGPGKGSLELVGTEVGCLLY